MVEIHNVLPPQLFVMKRKYRKTPIIDFIFNSPNGQMGDTNCQIGNDHIYQYIIIINSKIRYTDIPHRRASLILPNQARFKLFSHLISNSSKIQEFKHGP